MPAAKEGRLSHVATGLSVTCFIPALPFKKAQAAVGVGGCGEEEEEDVEKREEDSDTVNEEDSERNGRLCNTVEMHDDGGRPAITSALGFRVYGRLLYKLLRPCIQAHGGEKSQ